MADTYKTITGPSEAVFTEKRSKFLAFAFPVNTASEALEHVEKLSKKYYDARHVCWAYMLGYKRDIFRANDNGEPSGTAGKPILGQINSKELTDVLVAVVRYFGGIKLGTSGLIVAYREAARMALDEAVVEERHVMQRLSFTYPYSAINGVMKVARNPAVKVVENVMDNSCMMTIDVNLDSAQAIADTLDKIDGLTFRQ